MDLLDVLGFGGSGRGASLPGDNVTNAQTISVYVPDPRQYMGNVIYRLGDLDSSGGYQFGNLRTGKSSSLLNLGGAGLGTWLLLGLGAAAFVLTRG